LECGVEDKLKGPKVRATWRDSSSFRNSGVQNSGRLEMLESMLQKGEGWSYMETFWKFWEFGTPEDMCA
jgi:hypothetical protein